MRGSVALSVVVVVFCAVATSPQQVVEPIVGVASTGDAWWLSFIGDGHPARTPLIYIVVPLILYRLLSMPLEGMLERRGRPRAILWAQCAAAIVATVATGYYIRSTIVYLDSLSYLERDRPYGGWAQLMAEDAVTIAAMVYLAATVLLLALALLVTALRRTSPPAARVFRAVGVIDITVFAALGAVQSWGSGLGSPLPPVALGVVGAVLALFLNLARIDPAGRHRLRRPPAGAHGWPDRFDTARSGR